MKIREYETKDIDQIIELFEQTVRSINRRDYSYTQVDAWVNSTTKETKSSTWNQEFKTNFTYVADIEGKVVGFIDMTTSGYLDRLYIHHQFQGMGIASSLLEKIEADAYKQSIKVITTKASISARPFFDKQNFHLITKQIVEIRGVQMTNYQMEKKVGQ
ncbi:GNAT family N-acetyltransferase [Guptibacillus hwajinpoensis]|uniref:GNAT family N-acetyltransferase n=1 Tax=Guptibacillus hwajinpoensis TaxID=208199 RepID=UPI001CFCD724|nr:GNAT family N-acetyltransferase [Pseudalkalibacillus hwajinpoensis]